MQWERTFDLSVPVEAAWDAFMNRSERTSWNNVFTGNAYGAGLRVEVTSEQATGDERHLAWIEAAGSDVTEMRVSFTATETGARITLTRSGFGSGQDWLNSNAGRFHGWVEAMLDSVLFAERGVRAARHTPVGRFYQALGRLGFDILEAPGGIGVGTVHAGLGRDAGLEEGDMLLTINDAPIFFRSDAWLIQRLLQPGQRVDFTYLRGNEVQSGSAILAPRASA